MDSQGADLIACHCWERKLKQASVQLSHCWCLNVPVWLYFRNKRYRCRLLWCDWNSQVSLTLVIAGNSIQSVTQPWNVHPRVWPAVTFVTGSSHLCAPHMGVWSCWSYSRFKNFCLRLNQPSNSVNISLMSAIAACYWSLSFLCIAAICESYLHGVDM